MCLDEPGRGPRHPESEELGRQLRRVVDGGTAMLLVDHDMGLVLGVCDRIVVLEFGQVIATGTPEEVRRDPRGGRGLPRRRRRPPRGADALDIEAG